MLTPKIVVQFKKDRKKMEKIGKDLSKLDKVMKDLCEEKPLGQKLKDHQLCSNWVGHRECHIEPDWLLIYKYELYSIIFVRTGSHSELF
ncbi:MAG: type II toxin-antitoxin system YafQ family toxin [Candidatus Riflebacteria bacterium]|nr:type II toxin-antitoxin system YafQ family toxin [Candidatus Riflebacteria bacterium]